jgi:hypothetical protein
VSLRRSSPEGVPERHAHRWGSHGTGSGWKPSARARLEDAGDPDELAVALAGELGIPLALVHRS